VRAAGGASRRRLLTLPDNSGKLRIRPFWSALTRAFLSTRLFPTDGSGAFTAGAVRSLAAPVSPSYAWMLSAGPVREAENVPSCRGRSPRPPQVGGAC